MICGRKRRAFVLPKVKIYFNARLIKWVNLNQL